MAQQQLKRKGPEVLEDKVLIVAAIFKKRWLQQKHNIKNWEIIATAFFVYTKLTISNALCLNLSIRPQERNRQIEMCSEKGN